MIRIIVLILFCTSMLSVADDTTTGEADGGIVFIPSLAFLEKELNFKQRQFGILPSRGEFTARIPMLALSLTTAYHRWFLTLKYDQALAEGSADAEEPEHLISPSGSEVYFWQPPHTEMPVGREDKNITLGYSMMNGLSLFTGYMKGTTTIKPPPTCENPVVYTPSPPVTQVYCQSYNYAWLRLRELRTASPSALIDDYEQTYTEEGPYVGFSYAWNMMDVGVLSFSTAYAEMNGSFKDNVILPVANFSGFKANGDVKGTSIGITWIQSLTDSSACFIDLRRQSYSMEAIDEITEAEFHTTETMDGITVGMQFYF